MFVASSLRSGSAGFQQQQDFKRLSERAQDLEEQIRVYNALKDESLRKESTAAEQEVYQKLMGQLDLLKDETRQEKEALLQKAKANQDKEFALNQYQQLVRNIINTNILAKSQIIRRDQTIVKKDATIEEKHQVIQKMEREVEQNNAQIASINHELAMKIKALKASKVSKALMAKKIEGLKADSAKKLKSLESENTNISSQLSQVKGTLAQTEEKLDQASATIEQQQQQVSSLAAQKEAESARYRGEIENLKQKHASTLAGERAALEAKMNKERLGAAARAKQLAQFAAHEKAKAAELAAQVGGLNAKIADTQSKLAGSEAEKQRALASVEGLKGDLARTREIANARKALAQRISQGFNKAGLNGTVDARTGEVTIDFEGEYFDTGSTSLKPKMRTILDKFMPAYAKNLFSDPKVAEQIASVEIVGFASSTFKGKYVNPKSTRPQDKAAIDYNLQLSFGRAKSIFNHVLSQGALPGNDRERLMPMLKVVGRGYLPEGKTESDIPTDMSEKEFCLKYNCQKAQKVIIKFNMKD